MTLTPFVSGQALDEREVTADFSRDFPEPDALLWVDISQPTGDELALLETELGLPSLAVEDAREAGQRPKIDEYPDCVLVVAYAASYAVPDDAPADEPRLGLHEVALFIGRRYIVSVRQRPQFTVRDLRQRMGAALTGPAVSATSLAYGVLDRIVDGYYEVCDAMGTRIEDIDAKVWGGLSTHDLNEAFALRSDLVRFRRVLAPLREVLNAMLRRDGGLLADTLDDEFHDLYDHVVTVYEEIEMDRELLAGALEGHLSMVSNRMNQVVLKVSAWAAIIAVPTVVASIYGMNFTDMPELRWSYGYPFALVIMLAAALGLYLAFKRRDWL